MHSFQAAVMVVAADGWDSNGDGLVSWWESTAAIVILSAMFLGAVYALAKYGHKALKAFFRFTRKTVHLVNEGAEILDDIRGTPGDPGFKESIRALRQEGLETAEIAAHVARRQAETSEEVTRRFDTLDERVEKIETLVVHEMNPNDGGSMKDHATATANRTVKIEQALIDKGIIEDPK